MTRVRRGLLAAILALAGVLAASPSANAQPERWLYVFDVEHASFEDLLALPTVARLAHAGGAGLMTLDAEARFEVPTVLRSLAPNVGGATLRVPADGSGRGDALAAADREIGRFLRAPAPGTVVTVIVLSTSSSASMLRAKDDLHPVVVATGTDLLGSAGPTRALTSDSTRRIGVVTELDLAPTIATAFGARFPGASDGSPIRVVDAPAPFELHERYVAMRRMTVPVQAAAGIYVTLAGLACVALLAIGRPVRPAILVAAAWLAMTPPMLAVALLAAGHLPTLSYATVVPFVVAVTAVGTLAFAPFARRDVLLAPAAIGVAVLAFFALEAALGWTAALTPFFGGSELDGGRFFGLGNVFIGVLMGAGLYVASRLGPAAGFVLLVAIAFFAGLPWTGANLGAAVTILAAAGMWVPVVTAWRPAWRGVAFAGATVVVGTLVVLLAHRYLTSVPTHVTRFEEASGGLAGAWGTFVDRLGVGVRLIERNPFALVPVVGLVVALAVVLRPPGSIAGVLASHPRWRAALAVLLAASVIAYVVNDSGAAACGQGFALGLGGLLWVSLVDRARKIRAI